VVASYSVTFVVAGIPPTIRKSPHSGVGISLAFLFRKAAPNRCAFWLTSGSNDNGLSREEASYLIGDGQRTQAAALKAQADTIITTLVLQNGGARGPEVSGNRLPEAFEWVGGAAPDQMKPNLTHPQADLNDANHSQTR